MKKIKFMKYLNGDEILKLGYEGKVNEIKKFFQDYFIIAIGLLITFYSFRFEKLMDPNNYHVFSNVVNIKKSDKIIKMLPQNKKKELFHYFNDILVDVFSIITPISLIFKTIDFGSIFFNSSHQTLFEFYFNFNLIQNDDDDMELNIIQNIDDHFEK
jgi:hypothetical protein